MRLFSLFMLIFAATNNMFAQNLAPDSDPNKQYEPIATRYTTVSFNASPLAVLLVPFNGNNSTATGPYSLSFKAYNKNKAFRFGIGADVGNDQEDNDSYLNIGFGWEMQRQIYKRWWAYGGMDFMLIGGRLNIPSMQDNAPQSGYGIAPLWGLRYHLNPSISISTESSLFMGMLAGDVIAPIAIKIIPPVAIWINYQFVKKNNRK